MFHAINFISVVCLSHCGLFSWTSKGFKHHVLRNSPFLITTVQLLDHREPLGLVLSGSTLVERGLLLPNTNNWLVEWGRRSLGWGCRGEHFWIVRTFPKWIPGFFWKSVICILKRFIPTDRGEGGCVLTPAYYFTRPYWPYILILVALEIPNLPSLCLPVLNSILGRLPSLYREQFNFLKRRFTTRQHRSRTSHLAPRTMTLKTMLEVFNFAAHGLHTLQDRC